MKKIIIFVFLFMLTLGLCACNYQADFGSQFIPITANGNGITDQSIQFFYDKDTKIVYLYTCGGAHASMCPYYIIVDGVPTLAIYGINYMEDK